MMREVLTRRFRRLVTEESAAGRGCASRAEEEPDETSFPIVPISC